MSSAASIPLWPDTSDFFVQLWKNIDMDAPATRGDISELRSAVEAGQRETRGVMAQQSMSWDRKMDEHEARDDARFMALERTNSQLTSQLALIGKVFTAIGGPLAVTVIIYLFRHW